MQVREKKPWWMCALEEYFWSNTRWQLVHNGHQNPGQFNLPSEEIRKFTRKYRKGERYIVFLYDLTKPMADVKVQYAPNGAEHNKKEETFERV
jgi:hypothetical protein